MAPLNWATYLERAVGKGHPTLSDTVNRALRQMLSESGYDPDASPFPGLMGPVFNVRSYGAVGDGVADDTAAIQAAITAAGAGVVFFPAGSYKITSTIVIAAIGVMVRGAGRRATKLIFAPTANDVLLSVTGGASIIHNWAMRDLTLHSDDSTFTKTALEIIDAGEFVVDNIEITGSVVVSGTNMWSGANSIGIHLKGREAGSFRDVWSVADRPLLFSDDPNTSGIVDNDHMNFHNFQGIANANPVVEIQTGVIITNLSFTGYQAWVRGTYGLYWVDTTATINASQLVLNNVRREQSTSATAYNVRIEHNSALQSISMSNCSWDSLQEGLFLRTVRRVEYTNSNYHGGGGRIAIDMTGITNSVLELNNSILGDGATVTLTSMARVFESRPTQTTYNFGEVALYANSNRQGLRHSVIATGSLPAAATANMDGTIIIEDVGAGDRNLIIYAGGQRFRIDGGAAF